jgi:hypothetical protein
LLSSLVIAFDFLFRAVRNLGTITPHLFFPLCCMVSKKSLSASLVAGSAALLLIGCAGSVTPADDTMMDGTTDGAMMDETTPDDVMMEDGTSSADGAMMENEGMMQTSSSSTPDAMMEGGVQQ